MESSLRLLSGRIVHLQTTLSPLSGFDHSVSLAPPASLEQLRQRINLSSFLTRQISIGPYLQVVVRGWACQASHGLPMILPVSDVFEAIAVPARRAMLDELDERDGQTLFQLCSRLALKHQLSLSRQAISRHLEVLESAGLVTTTREGKTIFIIFMHRRSEMLANDGRSRARRARTEGTANENCRQQHLCG